MPLASHVAMSADQGTHQRLDEQPRSLACINSDSNEPNWIATRYFPVARLFGPRCPRGQIIVAREDVGRVGVPAQGQGRWMLEEQELILDRPGHVLVDEPVGIARPST